MSRNNCVVTEIKPEETVFVHRLSVLVVNI